MIPRHFLCFTSLASVATNRRKFWTKVVAFVELIAHQSLAAILFHSSSVAVGHRAAVFATNCFQVASVSLFEQIELKHLRGPLVLQ